MSEDVWGSKLSYRIGRYVVGVKERPVNAIFGWFLN